MSFFLFAHRVSWFAFLVFNNSSSTHKIRCFFPLICTRLVLLLAIWLPVVFDAWFDVFTENFFQAKRFNNINQYTTCIWFGEQHPHASKDERNHQIWSTIWVYKIIYNMWYNMCWHYVKAICPITVNSFFFFLVRLFFSLRCMFEVYLYIYLIFSKLDSFCDVKSRTVY